MMHTCHVSALHIRQRGHCWNSMFLCWCSTNSPMYVCCIALLLCCAVLDGLIIRCRCLSPGRIWCCKQGTQSVILYLPSTSLLIIAGFDWTGLIAKQMPRPSFWESFRRNIENGLIFCWKLHGLIQGCWFSQALYLCERRFCKDSTEEVKDW